MSNWEYKTGGIPDEYFIRGKVPMTKEEVRAVILSKLRLKKDYNLLDLGAGTGSVSIEVALQCSEGRVKAVERNPEGVKLIEQNCTQFGLDNVDIVEGYALNNIDDIADYDRIFIGGSGGELEDILSIAIPRMKKGGLIVVTSITVETLYKSTKKLEELNMDVDITSISVSKNRKVGSYNLLEALNTVYIITGTKR